MSGRIEPAALLAHAGWLVDSVGPERAVALRRATSAAYYAVFHALALDLAAHVAPRAPDAWRLTRSVEPRSLAQVLGWLDRRVSPRESVRAIFQRLRDNPALVTLGKDFLLLQAARYAADYDHGAAVSADGTRREVARATTMLGVVETLRGSADYEDLLGVVALHTSLR